MAKIEDHLRTKLKINNLNLVEIEIKGLKYEFRTLYLILDMLGIGAFGVVLETYNKRTHEINALKILTQENSKQMFRLDDKSMEEQVLSNLVHSNIIVFKGMLKSSEHVFIEMEKVNGGTLEAFI